MRPGGSTKVAAAKTTVFEDSCEETTRKSLHPLQPTATDKENLVGAGRRLRSSNGKPSLKNEINENSKVEVVKKAINKSNTMNKNEVSKKVEISKSDFKKVKEKVSYSDMGIQTDLRVEVSLEDLTSEANPSENYWKILAERRAVALQDALEENEMLNEQLSVYKEMLDESRALVEVFKEMIGEDRSDINNSLDDSRV